MSRIGRLPINIPEGVTVTVNDRTVRVNGPKGTVELVVPIKTGVGMADGRVVVKAERGNLLGAARANIANAVVGVTTGWKKVLELSGTGYRAAVSGSSLQLALGFSHPVVIAAPEGVTFEVKDNKIAVSGCDKAMVGQQAAKIRGLRPADPYKAKGFKYEDEVIIKKPGKAAKAGAAVAGAK